MEQPARPYQGIPLWGWVVLFVVTATMLALLLSRDKPAEPGQALRYTPPAMEGEAPVAAFKEVAGLDVPLEGPSALAVASDGRFYVGGATGLVILDAAGAEQQRLSLDEPVTALAALPDGAGVALGLGDRVGIWTKADAPLARWESQGEKALITSIAADAGHVYAADAGQRKVFCYDRGGTLQRTLGEKDPARDIPGLIIPSPYFDVAFDNDGALWVVNPGRHGLEQYRPDGSLVTSWYRPSMSLDGFCGCCNPSHIAFQSDGTLVTVEKGLVRAKRYRPDHTFLDVVAADGVLASRSMSQPIDEATMPIKDLAVDAPGRILMLDAAKKKIRIFVKAETPVKG